MPTLAGSPYKPRPPSYRPDSDTPQPAPPLPPKPIDLNSSTRSTDRDTGAKVTRRAFLCDVVVESEGEETSNLLSYIARPLAPLSTLPQPSSSTTSTRPATPSRLSSSERDEVEVGSIASEWTREKQGEMDKKLAMLIEELVRTERSYLSRLNALKTSYADNLRAYAKQPYSMIIPLYEAKTLFANIDSLVPASAAFLMDLEEMWRCGRSADIVGDVCLKHFKDLRTFDPYRTYLSKQDESQRMFQDVLKKYSGFASFIESTKYQTTGIGNIGLRELLMEPVQRIPRYTLLWHSMVKCMPPLSPQRAKLVEAIQIASRIAKCEPDPQTVRATVMYCLERNIEGFPASLFSNSRNYLDCIDVDDLPTDYSTASPDSRSQYRPMSVTSNSTSASTPSLSSLGSTIASSQAPTSPQSNIGSGLSPLHCSLVLFDDKLMIVKRQSSTVSGCKVTGLDDLQKLVKSGGGVSVMEKTGSKKDKLSFRGVVDILDVIATDIGDGDFHLFFERPPVDQTDRWSGRPFRSYTTVQPPFTTSLDPVAVRRDKLRFVQNLWAAQARVRFKREQSIPARVMIGAEEVGLEQASEAFGRAKCYFDVWDRPVWTQQTRKAKVAIHIDEHGTGSDLPVGEDGGPCMMIRLQPMAGSLCRFSFSVNSGSEDSRAVIDFGEVTERIITTIHQYGIFIFRTSNNSAPTTPSSHSHRLRPSMLNLDAISRNLFGAGSVSSRSHASGSSNDMFGTSSTKRSKPGVSRTSTMDTRISVDMRHTSSEESRKRFSKSSSSPSSAVSSEDALVIGAPYQAPSAIGQSEVDLNERLNLARKNSKSMAALVPAARDLDQRGRLGAKSVMELRSKVERGATMERAETDFRSQLRSGSPGPLPPSAPLRVRNKTPSPTRPFNAPDDTPKSTTDLVVTHMTPTLASAPSTSVNHVLVTSPRQLDESTANPSLRPSSTPIAVPLSPRPQGPRSPVPRQQATLGSAHTRLRVVSGGGRRVSAGRETIPLKDGAESPTESTPTMATKRQHSADQLSPRKRSPSRSPFDPKASSGLQIMHDPPKVPSLSRKSVNAPGSRRSSGQKTPVRSAGPLTTPRRVSAGQNSITSVDSKATSATEDVVMTDHADVEAALEATTRRLLESRAATKRLRTEIHGLRKQIGTEKKRTPHLERTLDRNTSLPRSPQRRNINRMIGSDASDTLSTSSRHGASSKHEVDAIVMDEYARGIASVVDRLDSMLKHALADGEQAGLLARRLKAEDVQKTEDIKSLDSRLTRSKETVTMLRQQLADTQVEVDVIYEAFNTELDGMFDDAQLPATEAFEAMRRDLQEAKAKRNDLSLENMRLKRELEEANLKREQWAKVLKERGIIS